MRCIAEHEYTKRIFSLEALFNIIIIQTFLFLLYVRSVLMNTSFLSFPDSSNITDYSSNELLCHLPLIPLGISITRGIIGSSPIRIACQSCQVPVPWLEIRLRLR